MRTSTTTSCLRPLHTQRVYRLERQRQPTSVLRRLRRWWRLHAAQRHANP